MNARAHVARSVRFVSGVLHGKHVWTHLGPAGAIILLAVVLVLLASFSYHGTRIVGDLVSRSVSMTLKDASDLEPGLPLDTSTPVQFDRFDTIAPRSDPQTGSNSAVLRGGDGTQIAALHLAAHSRLAVGIEPVKQGWDLRLLMGAPGGASLEIQAGAGATLDRESGTSWAPGVVRVSTEGKSAVPMRFEATAARTANDSSSPDGPAILEGVSVSSLRFGRESGRPADEAFASSIVRGSITLVDNADKEDLQIGSPLALTGLDGSISRLSLEHDGMHLLFTGYVDKVELGPSGFARRLTPSVLDVYYHRRSWRLFGAAAILIFAAWVTNAFAKEKQ